MIFRRKFGALTRGSAALLAGLILAESIFRLFLYYRNNAAHGDDRNVFELFVLGGSAVVGQPYEPREGIHPGSGLTLGGTVSAFLEDNVNGRAIIVRNLAQKGHTAYQQRALFQLHAAHRRKSVPGAVLIYSGHNDNVVYAGEGVNRVPPRALLYEALSPYSLLFTQLVVHWEKNGARDPFRHYTYWKGNLPVYELSLRRMIELSRKNGLVPVIATVAGNVSDFDPGLPFGQDEAYLDTLRRGLTLENSGRPGEARLLYQSVLNIAPPPGTEDERSILPHVPPPTATYARFRIARCLERLGRWNEAKKLYQAVTDAGGDHHRANNLQNTLIRRLAAAENVALADALFAFENASPHGLTGHELFADVCHPNLEGHALLGRLFAERLAGITGTEMADLSMDAVKRTFRLTDEFLAEAHLSMAGWHIFMSLEHALPEERMDRAVKYLRDARRLDPDSPRVQRLQDIGEGLRKDLSRLRDPVTEETLKQYFIK